MSYPTFAFIESLIRAHLNSNFSLPAVFESAGERGFVVVERAENGVVLFQYEGGTIAELLENEVCNEDLDRSDIEAALMRSESFTRENVGDNNAKEHFAPLAGGRVAYLRMEFAANKRSLEMFQDDEEANDPLPTAVHPEQAKRTATLFPVAPFFSSKVQTTGQKADMKEFFELTTFNGIGGADPFGNGIAMYVDDRYSDALAGSLNAALGARMV